MSKKSGETLKREVKEIDMILNDHEITERQYGNRSYDELVVASVPEGTAVEDFVGLNIDEEWFDENTKYEYILDGDDSNYLKHRALLVLE